MTFSRIIAELDVWNVLQDATAAAFRGDWEAVQTIASMMADVSLSDRRACDLCEALKAHAEQL